MDATREGINGIDHCQSAKHDLSSPHPIGAFKFSVDAPLSASSDASTLDLAYPPELDGNDAESIAICGFSIKFPDDATTAENLWKIIVEQRCATKQFPSSRINAQGFFCKNNLPNAIPIQGGHFIQEDLSLFDADFFSISPSEASSMDPMQRWLLEAVYRALENAGIPMEDAYGSSTAVYTGSFSMDHMIQLFHDPENMPKYTAVGVGLCMLANRLSWFFDFKGASIGIDTACSSSAVGIDLACQALRNGSCDMSVVTGCNLTYSPEYFKMMTNLGFLSLDARCYSFDHRANGYARGEGIGVIILKRLADAIRDGNTIRAVIRSTGSNEDGRTQGITQPSSDAQERLIRETYRRAGLSMAHTRFFEAHGTGTPLGDPLEARAIGRAFREHRTKSDPMYIGAIKSNIGHLEGASGIAGVIKAVLALEKGVIPPNTNFEQLNPKIEIEQYPMKFPQQCQPWPTSGLRRASINSFGYGGANCHIVLDDAYNFLSLRNLPGRHCSVATPPIIEPERTSSCVNGNKSLTNGEDHIQAPKLLVWSAADEQGLNRIAKSYENFMPSAQTKKYFLDNLAFTLDSRRSRFPWASFAVIRSLTELQTLKPKLSLPVQRSTHSPRVGYVFTGQGAQWFAMGRELMCYTLFEAELSRANDYLKTLGCPWSVTDELLKSEHETRVHDPELSQTLCTVIQIALVNLLRSFGVHPSAVVGHSSGEIAAGYAAGILAADSAWKLAYFRGVCSAKLSSSQPQGAMLAVNSSETSVEEIVATVNREATSYGLGIACINSPKSVTVAGEAPLVDKLKAILDEKGILSRKLRVSVAYHSRQMCHISQRYREMIGALSTPPSPIPRVPMISSLTGNVVGFPTLLDPSYWVRNMENPVRFSQAIFKMCSSDRLQRKDIDYQHSIPVIDHLMEIGPHSALQTPLRDILQTTPQGSLIGYSSMLVRGQEATATALAAIGSLYCKGYPVNLRAVNETSNNTTAARALLTDLPEYPFDHSRGYWHESRLGRNYRLRKYGPSELIGTRSNDWNASDARWRHFLRTRDMPWLEHHIINGAVLYPAGGMLAMAIEAARQLSQGSLKPVLGYTLRNVTIQKPIDLTTQKDSEVQTSLRLVQRTGDESVSYEFIIRTYTGDDDEIVNCVGDIIVELAEATDGWVAEQTKLQRLRLAEEFSASSADGTQHVDSQQMYRFLNDPCGFDYGPSFQVAEHQFYNPTRNQVSAELKLFNESLDDHLIHPITLDAFFHLPLTAITSGGSQPSATCVPTRLNYLWLAAAGLASSSMQQPAKAVVTVTDTNTRGSTCSGIGIGDADTHDVRLWYDGLELTNVTAHPAPAVTGPDPRKRFMNVDCRPSLRMLELSELDELLTVPQPDEAKLSEFYRDLALLVEVSLDQFLSHNSLSADDMQSPWKPHFWNWVKHHSAEAQRKQRWADPESIIKEAAGSFPSLCSRLKSYNAIGNLYSTAALNLTAIWDGTVDPLELFIHTDLLKDTYELLLDNKGSSKQIYDYMDLLAHGNPGMNILEVGGGTGGGARNLLAALCARRGDHESFLRCNRYDFTDVSSSFFGPAREEFAPYLAQMNFRTLDIERDWVEQQFPAGAYDVVVAIGVLHISSDLKATMKRVRRALKPGGKLIMQENFIPSGWTLSYVFGLFPGWWMGVEDNRVLSPSITVDEWDTLLKDCGFSGVDIFRDLAEARTLHQGWVISTAVEEIPTHHENAKNENHISIFVDEDLPRQVSYAQALASSLGTRSGFSIRIQSCSDIINRGENSDDIVIFLADYGQFYLQTLGEPTWDALKHLVRTSRKLLWVTTGGGRLAHPSHAMLDGLSRTLRFEHEEICLVTLALEDIEPTERQVLHVTRILEEMSQKLEDQNYEQEYIEIDGLLHTRRLVEANRPKFAMDKRLVPLVATPTKLDTGASFTTTVRAIGDSRNPCYAKTPSLGESLHQENFVDIAVKSVALQPVDHPSGHDHDDNHKFGKFFGGEVVDCHEGSQFLPGSRVFGVCPGALRSHVSVSPLSVVEIPAELPYLEACLTIPLFCIAYAALFETGHVTAADTVLVDGGISPISLAAIISLSIQQNIKDLWVTAEDENSSTLFSSKFGIPKERILPRRWLDSSCIISSQWKQRFDVVFSAQHTSPMLSLGHVRHGGRYIQLSSNSVSRKNANLQGLQDVSSGISISLIDPATMTISPEDLRCAAVLAGLQGSLIPKSEAKIFSAPELEDAFNTLRDLGIGDYIVVEFNKNDVINVMSENTPKLFLNPAATYLIAGGLGGLGQEIARWLVSRGARFLMLLSRSGLRKEGSIAFVDQLKAKGVVLETPVCDVTNMASLHMVLQDCSQRMPPVRGCIHAAMVLKEVFFDDMTFNDWKAVTAPKVEGSWNLHSALPQGLDFFVMISSVQGILGTGLLAAYNAGNTYQDSLARYRLAQGERAVAIDLGVVTDGGFLAGNSRYDNIFKRNRKLAPICMEEVYALLDIACEPSSQVFYEDAHSCQGIVGITQPASWNLDDESFTMSQPFWGHMHHAPLRGYPDGDDTDVDPSIAATTGRKQTVNYAELLSASESTEDAAKIITDALVTRVSSLVGTEASRIEVHKSIQSYGIDSISAIDVRNWVMKAFAVDTPIFELLSDSSFATVAANIAQKTRNRHDA
ncbi:putative polyketide synthase [Nemania sp. FL0031]|nr:putative polyketide synthase [Nemania sp. FL0031]